MKKGNFKTIIILGAVAILIFGTYFVWHAFFKSTEPKPEDAITPRFTDASRRTPDFESPPKTDLSSFFEKPDSKDESGVSPSSLTGDVFEVPKLPISSPSTFAFQTESPVPTPEQFESFFEDINTAAEKAQEAIETIFKERDTHTAVQPEKEVSSPTEQKTGASELPTSITIEEGIKVEMTKEEFNYLYPSAYIDILMQSQTLLKQYDPNYQIISEIKTDEDVRHIEESTVAALYSAGMLTEDETERYITAIRFTLPQLQTMELEARRKNLYQLEPEKTQKNKIILLGLLEKFQSLFINKSEAGGGPCGYCFWLPECYSSGPYNPVMGPNTVTAFCYCDGCLRGQGCLDRCQMMGMPAAIWDPMTGICGCG